jgi:hypothetical protein
MVLTYIHTYIHIHTYTYNRLTMKGISRGVRHNGPYKVDCGTYNDYENREADQYSGMYVCMYVNAYMFMHVNCAVQDNHKIHKIHHYSDICLCLYVCAHICMYVCHTYKKRDYYSHVQADVSAYIYMHVCI